MLPFLAAEPPTLHVYDVGASCVRGGFGGEDVPKVTCLNVCARPPRRAVNKLISLRSSDDGNSNGLLVSSSSSIDPSANETPVGFAVFKWLAQRRAARSIVAPWSSYGDSGEPDWKSLLDSIGPRRKAHVSEVVLPVGRGGEVVDKFCQRLVLDKVRQELSKHEGAQQHAGDGSGGAGRPKNRKRERLLVDDDDDGGGGAGSEDARAQQLSSTTGQIGGATSSSSARSSTDSGAVSAVAFAPDEDAENFAGVKVDMSMDVDDEASLLPSGRRRRPAASSAGPAVFFSDPVVPNLTRRELLLEWAFETLDASVVKFAPQPLMGLAGCGLASGLVIDVGETLSQVAAVSDASVASGQKCLPCGGRDVTRQLARLLSGYGLPLSHPEDMKYLEDLKKSSCFVSTDIAADLRRAKESNELDKKVKLPDGQELTLRAERFTVPEIMFTPRLLDGGRTDASGIATAAVEVVNSLPVDLRLFFCTNIVLLGGSSLFDGFVERMRSDVRSAYLASVDQSSLSPDHTSVLDNMTVNVHAHPHRNFLTFRGSAIMANHLGPSKGYKGWLTRHGYNEKGPKAAAVAAGHL